jgi:hypothetical protein
MPLLQRRGAPNCPAIRAEAYCREHAGGWSRGPHPSRWRKLSRRIRDERPVCEWPGCEQPSEVVHHIDGLGCRGPRGYDMGNLMALSAQHHNPISAQQRWAGEPVQLPRRHRLLSF